MCLKLHNRAHPRVEGWRSIHDSMPRQDKIRNFLVQKDVWNVCRTFWRHEFWKIWNILQLTAPEAYQPRLGCIDFSMFFSCCLMFQLLILALPTFRSLVVKPCYQQKIAGLCHVLPTIVMSAWCLVQCLVLPTLWMYSSPMPFRQQKTFLRAIEQMNWNCTWSFFSAMKYQNYVSISVNFTVCFQCLAIPPQVLPVALPVPTKAPSRQVSQEVRVEPPGWLEKAPCLLWPLLVLEIATCLSRYNQISVSKSVTSEDREDSHYTSSRFDLVQQPTGSSENESLSPFPDKLRSLVGHFSPTFSGSRALTPRWEAAAATEVDGAWWSWRFDDWLESETHTHTHWWLNDKWHHISHAFRRDFGWISSVASLAQKGSFDVMLGYIWHSLQVEFQIRNIPLDRSSH